MTLKERQSRFEEFFNALGSWQERFQYLIDLGKELPTMPGDLIGQDSRIRSCNSLTFFVAEVRDDVLLLKGWSNASVPSGMIVMLKSIFDGVSRQEVRSTPVDFHIRTGLTTNLTSQRAAALAEMTDRVIRA